MFRLAGGLLSEMSISEFEKSFFLLSFYLLPNTCPVVSPEVRPHICNRLLCGNEFLGRVFGMFLNISSASIKQHLCSYLAMEDQSLISQAEYPELCCCKQKCVSTYTNTKSGSSDKLNDL